jgi:aryl-alcohol dehydrogenase-like predicted oxidoreductase
MNQSRRLAHANVNPIGLGCMNLSHAYGTPIDSEAAIDLLNRALDHGYNFLDTAALYGFGNNESLLGRALTGRRDEFFLASKCGMTGVTTDKGTVRVIDGRPATIRATCEASLKRLNTDVIDLYYLHRWDKQVPIEESVGALGDLVRAGKIRSIGLSEVSASTLRKAHQEFPVAALQSEYSLWSRNPELGTLAACEELGIQFVAFSPLGRGFLGGKLSDPSLLESKDIRSSMPRFAQDNYRQWLPLLDQYKALAKQTGCTPAQLALAWLLHKSQSLLVIPGTSNRSHMIENGEACQVHLSRALMQQVETLINADTVPILRYNDQALSEVDSEEFAHHRKAL